MSIKELFALLIGCVLSSNYALTHLFNTETMLLTSRKSILYNLSFSLYLCIVLVLSSLLIYPIETYIIGKGAVELRIVVYVVMILLVTSLVSLITKKKNGELFSLSLSSSLLGTALQFQGEGYGFLSTLFASAGTALGYFIVTLMLSLLRERVNDKYVPAPFRGYPIMLVALSIISLTVYCF